MPHTFFIYASKCSKDRQYCTVSGTLVESPWMANASRPGREHSEALNHQ